MIIVQKTHVRIKTEQYSRTEQNRKLSLKELK